MDDPCPAVTPPLATVPLLLYAVACAAVPRSEPADVVTTDCVVVDEQPAVSPVTIGLLETVLPTRAPAARNASERLVFGQLYETLVRVDCEGNVVSGLAETWSSQRDGRVWEFRIHPAAVFHDGSLVTAATIATSWTSPIRRDGLTIVRVTVESPTVLRVELDRAVTTPRVFASLSLAAARMPADSSWPVGTGAFRPAADTGTALAFVAGRPQAPSAIRFRTFAGSDPRSALDAGVDALITVNPATLDYARALNAYAVTPLGWTVTYALASPRDSAEVSDSGPVAMPAAALAELATRAESRPPVPPFWWLEPACRSPAASSLAPPQRRAAEPLIVYPAADAIARDVAERLAALSWPASRTPAWLARLLPDGPLARAPIARGLSDAAMIDAVLAGDAYAAVLPLPRAAGDGCPADDPAAGILDAGLLATWRVSPLFDVRDQLVHRNGLGRAVLDGNGTLIFGAAR